MLRHDGVMIYATQQIRRLVKKRKLDLKEYFLKVACGDQAEADKLLKEYWDKF